MVKILEYSEEKTRELFEQALSDVGLHVTKVKFKKSLDIISLSLIYRVS